MFTFIKYISLVIDVLMAMSSGTPPRKNFSHFLSAVIQLDGGSIQVFQWNADVSNLINDETNLRTFTAQNLVF